MKWLSAFVDLSTTKQLWCGMAVRSWPDCGHHSPPQNAGTHSVPIFWAPFLTNTLDTNSACPHCLSHFLARNLGRFVTTNFCPECGSPNGAYFPGLHWPCVVGKSVAYHIQGFFHLRLCGHHCQRFAWSALRGVPKPFTSSRVGLSGSGPLCFTWIDDQGGSA